jgi:hypothetical protein
MAEPRSDVLTGYFPGQSRFDAWAQETRSSRIAILSALLLFIAASCATAVAIMGPRLAREGMLLWFGTRTDGIVEQMKAEEAGRFKGGAPKYRLTIDYRFVAADGSAHAGTTMRGDVRTIPSYAPGDTIGVYYDPAAPGNSVAEHNLRSDVYALLIFLPFLTLVGIAPALWFFLLLMRWKSRAA